MAEFPSIATLLRYRFITGDVPERDPISFELQGSINGNDWHILHVADYVTPDLPRPSPTEMFHLDPKTDVQAVTVQHIRFVPGDLRSYHTIPTFAAETPTYWSISEIEFLVDGLSA